MDYFTESEIAQLLDVQAVEKVSFESPSYGSISYFKYAQDGDGSASQAKQVWLFRVNDGFIYTLRFSGPEQNYNDEFSRFAGSLMKVTQRQTNGGLLNWRVAKPRAPWEQITKGEFPTEIFPWFTDRVLRATPYYIPGWNLLAVVSRSVPLLQGYNVETYDSASKTYAAVTMTRGQIVGLLFVLSRSPMGIAAAHSLAVAAVRDRGRRAHFIHEHLQTADCVRGGVLSRVHCQRMRATDNRGGASNTCHERKRQ